MNVVARICLDAACRHWQKETRNYILFDFLDLIQLCLIFAIFCSFLPE